MVYIRDFFFSEMVDVNEKTEIDKFEKKK